MSGPFETEDQARSLPAVRAVYTAFDLDPGAGKMAPHNYRMLAQAAEAAGVELGAYDDRILHWLAGWEPTTCAVLAGIVGRARPATRTADDQETGFHICRAVRACSATAPA